MPPLPLNWETLFIGALLAGAAFTYGTIFLALVANLLELLAGA